MTLSPPLEICEQIFSHSRLAHFNIPNWARYLLPMAKAYGVTIAADLQDMADLNDPYRQDFIDAADILFFSAANQADPRQITAALLQRRSESVVIAGMGARGCLLATSADGIRQYPPVEMDDRY
jgi:sugar/nucleoside kinase (ribokinase family)